MIFKKTELRELKADIRKLGDLRYHLGRGLFHQVESDNLKKSAVIVSIFSSFLIMFALMKGSPQADAIALMMAVAMFLIMSFILIVMKATSIVSWKYVQSELMDYLNKDPEAHGDAVAKLDGCETFDKVVAYEIIQKEISRLERKILALG